MQEDVVKHRETRLGFQFIVDDAGGGRPQSDDPMVYVLDSTRVVYESLVCDGMAFVYDFGGLNRTYK